MAGFWKAPRELARMLAAHELTPSEYTLLNFMCQSGADRPGGFTTTNGLLASVLDVNEKTVRRALRGLRARGFIAFEDHERVAVFAVQSADTLRTLEGVSMSTAMSTAMSAEPADMAPSQTPRQPASLSGNSASEAADTNDRSETETETREENLLLNPPPEGGGLPEDLIERAVETVGAVATAREAHDRLHEVLEANGFRCEREVLVEDRGDGRPGRLDLVVYDDDAGHATAIELDFQSPRRKSLAKLRSFRGGRIVVLREGPPPSAPDGIDAVYSLNPTQPRGRHRGESTHERIRRVADQIDWGEDE